MTRSAAGRSWSARLMNRCGGYRTITATTSSAQIAEGSNYTYGGWQMATARRISKTVSW
ncbi:hypothetical protein ACNKHV_05235 [Shigella flexneri]